MRRSHIIGLSMDRVGQPRLVTAWEERAAEATICALGAAHGPATGFSLGAAPRSDTEEQRPQSGVEDQAERTILNARRSRRLAPFPCAR